jgi:hypothetical protein
MKLVFAILATIAGAYCALGIWFPRFRAHWKGTGMTCGPVSCAGFALFLLSFGATLIFVESVPERYKGWFFYLVVIGWILGAIGYVLDRRAHSRTSMVAFVAALPTGSSSAQPIEEKDPTFFQRYMAPLMVIFGVSAWLGVMTIFVVIPEHKWLGIAFFCLLIAVMITGIAILHSRVVGHYRCRKCQSELPRQKDRSWRREYLFYCKDCNVIWKTGVQSW